MSIVRVPARDLPYVQIRNDTVRDQRLSWEARGLLAYLLSQPPNWQVRVSAIVKEAPSGRDRVYRILRELREAGYVEYLERRDDAGKIVRSEYIVRELPLPEKPYTADPQEPLPEKPDTAEPDAAKPDAYKDEGLKKTGSEEDEDNTSDGSAADTTRSLAVVEHPDAQRLCDLLADRIGQWSGERPNVGKRWLDAARLLIDRDGLTPKQVEYLITWATGSEFWRPNILSMPKLRERRLTLIGQIKREHGTPNNLEPFRSLGLDPRTAEQRDADLLAEVERAREARHQRKLAARGEAS